MKHSPEHAVAVEPEVKDANLKRLRRIEGQIRGIHKMVEEDRYCPDIITQIASAQQALRGVGRQLLRNHLKHCATTASMSSVMVAMPSASSSTLSAVLSGRARR